MITANANISQFDSRLLALRERMRAALVAGMTDATIKMVQIVKEEKLSGQVLNRRSGRLSRSIKQRVEEMQDGGVRGIIGLNEVKYGIAHEFGFCGAVNVRTHERRMRSGRMVNVRAHDRMVNMRERSFLRSTRDESMDLTREILRKRIAAALEAV